MAGFPLRQRLVARAGSGDFPTADYPERLRRNRSLEPRIRLRRGYGATGDSPRRVRPDGGRGYGGGKQSSLSLSLQSVKSALATAEPVPRRRRVIRGWKVPAASMSYEPLAGRESSHF